MTHRTLLHAVLIAVGAYFLLEGIIVLVQTLFIPPDSFLAEEFPVELTLAQIGVAIFYLMLVEGLSGWFARRYARTTEIEE